VRVGVDEQRVTVGGGRRHHRWGGRATRTRMVLDCYGLVPQLSKLATHNGRDHLWLTARSERFNHPHESRRIVGFSGQDRCSHGVRFKK
jgi:hypothetical protein